MTSDEANVIRTAELIVWHCEQDDIDAKIAEVDRLLRERNESEEQ